MYATVRVYQTKLGMANEVIERVTAPDGFAHLISQAPGFVAYYVLNGGSNRVVSVSIFESQAQAEQSIRLAADWVQQHLASLLPNPPELYTGEVAAITNMMGRTAS